MNWTCRDRTITFARRPWVMGVVNVTPDSFSDGGRFLDPGRAVAHALELAGQGADILDIGGESTRPGAAPVPADEELRRVLPVVTAVARQCPAVISVDTMKAAVARACLDAGAHVVNDVSGLTHDPDMAGVCAAGRAGVVVMHMQGTPRTMQQHPAYADVTAEVAAFLRSRLHALAEAGIPTDAVCVDPGIGFGKTTAHNLELLARLGEVAAIGRPVCLGVSRKRFVGELCGRTDAADRAAGSLAVGCFAVARGHAHILRVHDVPAARDACLLLDAIDARRRP